MKTTITAGLLGLALIGYLYAKLIAAGYNIGYVIGGF